MKTYDLQIHPSPHLSRNLQGVGGEGGAPVASENRTGTSHARGCGNGWMFVSLEF